MMRTIGLIGGMSWESTVTYYQLLNRMARERLGGLHSAQLVMWSFDFANIEALQARGAWDEASLAMVDAARRIMLDGAGLADVAFEIGLLLVIGLLLLTLSSRAFRWQ